MNKRLIGLSVAALFVTACSNEKEAAVEDMTPDVEVSESELAPLWLEEVEGEKALEKVQSWNKSTLDKLTADPRFSQFQSDALDVVNATDRIPYGNYYGGYVYNFWQNAEQVRGVLRRTSLDSYSSDSTEWETMIDMDKLAADNNKNWVYKGTNCYDENYDMCLLLLSDGGKDAVEVREWSHATKSFVENGFALPEAKSSVAWKDEKTILVGTDWGEQSLTESGYPFITKILSRGQALSDAKEIFRGEVTDVAAGVYMVEIAEDQKIMMAYRATSFFTSEYYWLKDDGTKPKLPIPEKSSPLGVFKGQLLVSLQDNWQATTDKTFSNGSVVSFDLKSWMESQKVTNAQLVFEPNSRSTTAGINITKSKVLITVSENVVGRVMSFDYDSTWRSSAIALPENGTVRVTSSNSDHDLVFVNQESFISPDTLYRVNAKTSEIVVAKQSPARFDASNLVVEQFEATSKDGVKIPYFVVRNKDIAYDGSNPSLLYAYGGFNVSMTPSYSGIRGKLWLEKGGVYILANIRGGGEFGPKWHQAGLKTNRQVILNDMIAVAESVIAKKITSPRRLGIMGGSNGGLLMGVMYNQRPDLWNAVVCQVPLLDMLRYHLLLAGASWVGEYGSPDIAEERAFLETISPLHNVEKESDYPSIFFVTSTKDDRVHPGHARKMAYLLEQYGHDFEYYENTDGGHSASANLKETAKRLALEYTYLAEQLMD